MKKHKIVFLAASAHLINELWAPKAQDIVEKYDFDSQVHIVSKYKARDLREILEDCDALITSWNSPVCTADFLRINAPSVKIIGHAAGSPVSVTDESTYDTGVKVITANQIMSEGVAEWSLMATLLAARNLGSYAALYGKSKVCFKKTEDMSDIKNMTIGLWGFGDTSKNLLKMLAPLKPGKILVCSRHSSAEQIESYGAEKRDFETVIKESDIFHALVGLTPSSFQRLGVNEFSMFKNGTTFINCARANLTQEKALLDELEKKRINAILDVFHTEPIEGLSKLNDLDNVVLTPHNAGYTGRDRFVPFILEEFNNFFKGRSLKSLIDKKRFMSMTNEALTKV